MFITPHSAKLLQKIMDLQGWSQFDIASRARVHRATVGQHLNLTRTIRDEHLLCYLQAVPAGDVPALVSAWLHDLLHAHPDKLHAVIDPETSRLQEPVTAWSPSLSTDQRTSLEFWAGILPVDAELAQLFAIITRRARGDATPPATPSVTAPPPPPDTPAVPYIQPPPGSGPIGFRPHGPSGS